MLNCCSFCSAVRDVLLVCFVSLGGRTISMLERFVLSVFEPWKLHPLIVNGWVILCQAVTCCCSNACYTCERWYFSFPSFIYRKKIKKERYQIYPQYPPHVVQFVLQTDTLEILLYRLRKLVFSYSVGKNDNIAYQLFWFFNSAKYIVNCLGWFN